MGLYAAARTPSGRGPAAHEGRRWRFINQIAARIASSAACVSAAAMITVSEASMRASSSNVTRCHCAPSLSEIQSLASANVYDSAYCRYPHLERHVDGTPPGSRCPGNLILALFRKCVGFKHV